MSDEPKPTSERARKRAAGKILREALIKRREAFFDLLVSGYSVEQIASATKKSPSTVRRAVGQALAKRRLDAPEDYARIQVARLTKALRCADVSLGGGRPEGDRAVRESRAGAEPLPRRQCRSRRDRACGAAGSRADIAPACAHAFARRGGRGGVGRRRKKLRKSAAKPLKSFARVNLCARRGRTYGLAPEVNRAYASGLLVASGLAARLANAVDPNHVLLIRGVEHDHALRRPAGDANAGDRHSNQLPAVRHQHEFVACFHRERGDKRAVARVDRHGDDAFAAAPGNAIFER